MTKIPRSIDNNQRKEMDNLGIANSRKNNYKSQKPILEKRRRDRINGSLDELKNLLLVIKQRDPLRYARLEKADILEMVVKYLKDLKKRRQAMIAAMEPTLFRSFKMGYLDCTRATIDFINEIETPTDRKKQIIDHITSECMSSLKNQCPPTNFNQHHDIVFSNVNPPEHFMPFPLLSSAPASFDSNHDMEWISLEERLGFSPIGKSNFILPDVKPLPDIISASSNVKDIKSSPMVSSTLLKIVEQPERQSAFNIVINKSNHNNSSNTIDTSLESQSTSGTSVTCNDDMPQQSIFISDINTSDDDDEDEENVGKLIIDDHNNNQTAWRPWL
ncbi:unnamed protein product [Chironomus riparius]|uniref:BHLH domain-containing protein n=1 Tax=Chironomus riparius TaxID=315576 RepID=A0A9N9RHD9_9DIPT|nr:unnamed protein product [Chironomus riparius]